MTGNILPQPLTQFLDNNGSPLAGGQIFTYASDGATPKATYQDAALTTLNPNPIPLDSAGRAQIYGTGDYVFAVFDSLGNSIYTEPTADTATSLNAGAFGLELLQTTTQAAAQTLLGLAALSIPIGLGPLPWPTAVAPSGWLLCFGQEVSRVTYSGLFGVIGTTYGTGNGSTTFNLPDMRGRGIFGIDAMGGTPANRLTSTSIGGSGGILAAIGGSQLAQMPTLTAVVTDPHHHHAQFYTGSFTGSGVPEGGVSNATGPGTVSPDMVTDNSATGVTVAVSSNLTGTQQNMPPLLVVSWIIYTGVP